MLPGGLASGALPGLPRASAYTYGAFNNVTQTLVINPATAEECKRMLNGTLNFSWPEPNAYFDVIFIRDTSASFAPVATTKPGSEEPSLPWCGTTTTSLRRCAASSRSSLRST